MEKILNVYIDSLTLPEKYYDNYTDTHNALCKEESIIHTTCLDFVSASYAILGYTICIYYKGEVHKIVDNVLDGTLKLNVAQNWRAMLVSGMFGFFGDTNLKQTL